jgi:hypothetical protein
MIEMLDRIGGRTGGQFLGSVFPLDPFGSFIVDSDAANVKQIIDQALDIGAIVYVGASDDEVPSETMGARFRLSFMLAPVYKLPLRNYPPVNLSDLLESASPDQYKLF